MLDARKRGSHRSRIWQMIVKRCIFHNWSSAAGQLCLCTQTIPYLLLVTAEPRTIWDAEETNVFKTVLQSIPLGASASVICNKVHAALREQGFVKTPDQVPSLPTSRSTSLLYVYGVSGRVYTALTQLSGLSCAGPDKVLQALEGARGSIREANASQALQASSDPVCIAESLGEGDQQHSLLPPCLAVFE